MSEIRVREDKDEIEGLKGWHWLWSDGKFEPGSWIGPSKEFPQLREKVMPYLKKRDVVLTAGGCQGMYPRCWAKYFKKVIAFEPSPDSFEVMFMNCQGEQYQLIRGALGDEKGRATFYLHDSSNVGMHSMVHNSSNSIEVDVYRIDDMNLEALDLLQLDIEGGEPNALLGAYETICTFRPVVVCETVNNMVQNFFNERKYRPGGQVVSDKIFIPD